MISSIFNIEESTKQNKELLTVLYKRYGQSRSLAYTCLLTSYNDRLKSIYQWIRTGKLHISNFENFVIDFLIKQQKQYTQDDTEDMISFIKRLK